MTERTKADRDSDLNVGRLIEAYDEYVGLLASAEGELLSLAHAHGYRTPKAQIERGKKLRERIAELKAAVLSPADGENGNKDA